MFDCFGPFSPFLHMKRSLQKFQSLIPAMVQQKLKNAEKKEKIQVKHAVKLKIVKALIHYTKKVFH